MEWEKEGGEVTLGWEGKRKDRSTTVPKGAKIDLFFFICFTASS